MPLIISPSLVNNEAITPLNHARIGYDNLIRSATVTTTGGEESGFPADAIERSTTWERWKPTNLPATIDIDAGSGDTASYLGIAAHTLGSTGATIQLEYSADNVEFFSVETLSPADDSPVFLLFNPTQARYWRTTTLGSGAARDA